MLFRSEIDLDGLPNPNNFKVIFPQNYLSQNVLVCDLIDTMEWKEDLIEGLNLPMCIISMLEACYKIKVQFLPYKKSKHHLSLSLSLSAIYIYYKQKWVRDGGRSDLASFIWT